MSAQSFELTLARLYTDQAFRQLFVVEPEKALAECDLSLDEKAQLMTIDKAGLIMASHSFMHKRNKRKRSIRARFLNIIKRFVGKRVRYTDDPSVNNTMYIHIL